MTRQHNNTETKIMKMQNLQNTARISVRGDQICCPLAERIAEQIPVREFLVKDEAVLDLYGYVSWIFDENRARGVFRTVYGRVGYRMRGPEVPTGAEIEAALAVMEESADAELAR